MSDQDTKLDSQGQKPRLRDCPDCLKQVSVRAEVCIHCGAPLRPAAMAKKSAPGSPVAKRSNGKSLAPVQAAQEPDTGKVILGSMIAIIGLGIPTAAVLYFFPDALSFRSTPAVKQNSEPSASELYAKIEAEAKAQAEAKDPTHDLVLDENWKTNAPYESSGRSAWIEGSIRNTSSHDYSQVQVVFDLYGNDSQKIGTATDTLNGLAAGETWRFTATAFGVYYEQLGRVKFNRIIAL